MEDHILIKAKLKATPSPDTPERRKEIIIEYLNKKDWIEFDIIEE